MSTFTSGYCSLVWRQISTPTVVEPPSPRSQQNQIGQLLLDEFPIGYFALGSTDDFSLWNIILEDTLCTLQFQGHVFYNDE